MKQLFICHSIKKTKHTQNVVLNVFDHTKDPVQGKIKLELDSKDTTFKIDEYYEVLFNWKNHDRR